MGYRTLIVNAHSKLSYRNNHLVFKSAERSEMIHLSEIDVLILETMDISITSMLIKRLIDEKIVVLFCDDKRLPQSMLLDLYGRYDNSKQIRKQIQWDDKNKNEAWLQIVEQKIKNQTSLLMRLDMIEKADRLYELGNEMAVGDPSNVEAHVARIYFNALFGNQFTRSDPTPINAGLNYGYSLILALFSREIVLNGCLTQLGMMHTNQFNRYNLASDLMEPFRPLIDTIVYENREQEIKQMKRKVLGIFEHNYQYRGQSMYLTNIVSDYVRRTIRFLDGDSEELPSFLV